jgi:hypothetical protein
MGSTLQNAETGVRARRTEDDQATAVGGTTAERSFSSPSIRSPGSRSEPRLNDRFARLLNQKKGPDAVMTGVLGVALLFGLVGFAFDFLWVVAIIVMALGLGFTVANSRRDRIDVVNQRAEARSEADDRATGVRQGSVEYSFADRATHVASWPEKVRAQNTTALRVVEKDAVGGAGPRK